MQFIRVLVVDDFEPFRQFVCSVVEQKLLFPVVGQASDGEEAIQEVKRTQPDLVVLDVGLPKLDGIKAARQIQEVAPEAKIIFLSQETSPDVMEEAMRSGALAYVVKQSAATDLSDAIETVLRGNEYFSSGLRTNLDTEERERAD